MASTGATLPGSGTATGTGTTWSNPGNITADDNTEATLPSGFGASQQLVATSFGFSVSASSIDGIEVTVGARYTASTIQAITAQLRNASGTLVGSTKSVSVSSGTETTYTLGGSADTWSASLTQTDINDADFGVEISVSGVNTYAIAIDWVKIDVTYTTSTTPTGTWSYFNWFYGGQGATSGAVALKFRRTLFNRVGKRGSE
jgi:hypothetical protein